MFRPLPVEHMFSFFRVGSKLDSGNSIVDIAPEDANTLIDLIRIMVQRSYPYLERDMVKESMDNDGKTEKAAKIESQEVIEDFISTNFFRLFEILGDVNTPEDVLDNDNPALKKAEEIKAKLQAAEDAKQI